jgi:3-phosphoglycerate kinase
MLAALPTIEYLCGHGARVVLFSHLAGRKADRTRSTPWLRWPATSAH